MSDLDELKQFVASTYEEIIKKIEEIEKKSVPSRFIKTEHGTVIDTQTSLEWGETIENVSWHEAKEMIDKLGDGWRMPTVHELMTVIDYSMLNPACNKDAWFISKCYWSGSDYVLDSTNAWNVYFLNGYAGFNSKTNSRYARPVRNAAI